MLNLYKVRFVLGLLIGRLVPLLIRIQITVELIGYLWTVWVWHLRKAHARINPGIGVPQPQSWAPEAAGS